MANSILPILSGSLKQVLTNIYKKDIDPIACEILKVDALVNDCINVYPMCSAAVKDAIVNKIIGDLITDEVRMITVRMYGEFEISFLPKDKEPEYTENGTWSRKNRQEGKPARIFQKLLKKEFKQIDWERFANRFKAEVCCCNNFQIVSGEDIREWYDCSNYFCENGTLGNSCMRYESARDYMDIYVDNAKMLITTKDGKLTGRALVWEFEDKTLLDRIYTCYDYLENCFIEYAKEHKWWIRSDNCLLHTGDWQYWLTPDDGYEYPVSPNIKLDIKHSYDQFPYVDSFRYYDGRHTLSTHEGEYCLDSTDGNWYERAAYECSRCGHTVYGYEGDDMPDDMHYSDYDDCYYCDDCCWWCDAVDSYISVDDSPTDVYEFGDLTTYPQSYINDNLILDPNGTESGSDIVKVDGNYFIVAHSSDKIIWNKEKSEYEIIS